jgi:thioredoxin 1
MSPVKLGEQDFEEKVLKADKPVLVDFFADWCGPCRQLAPIIDVLAEENKGNLEVFRVNVDENQSLAGQYGVMSIPTVIMFKEGKEIERLIGFRGREGYDELIKKVL